MKKLLFIATALVSLNTLAQSKAAHVCSQGKKAAFAHIHALNQLNQKTSQTASLPSHEKGYDVKFVHLMLDCERTTKYIFGGVRTVATVTVATLDTFSCLLHQNHIIDSVRINSVLLSSVRKDSVIKVKLPSTLNSGQTLDVYMYYHGTPPVGGSAIGSGYSNGTSGSWGNQVSWSLSESLAGYHWWPCKQILTDKIDSSWVFITTDSSNKVGSNGILQNVVNLGAKSRYEWKSRKPIAYYLISVAVAKYKEYNIYAKPTYLAGDSIWIQNYIYDNAINNPTFISGQKIILDKIKPTMEFECNMYGMYPFYKEKYGHCMAPFGGGMEHQTMTSLGFFDYYVDAHELGHQWWGDNVTCKSWADIWINEGWASYTEHLVAQYLDPPNFLPNLNAAHNNVMSAPGGMCWLVGTDTTDANKIFDSRLTYDKGGAIIRSLQFNVNNDSLWFNGLRSFQQAFKNTTASVQDFKNYIETYTSMNFTQFFNQWYYGQGYPTFNLTWNFFGNKVVIKSVQSTSTPTSVPLFITPIQYLIKRTSAPDTTVRVTHSNTTENYTFTVLGTVTTITVDPNQWIINKATVAKDITLGVDNYTDIAKALNISPNPTSGNITIKAEGLKGMVEVYDANGRLLGKEVINNELMIDLGNRDAGVYMLNIKDDVGKLIRTEKIIKQ